MKKLVIVIVFLLLPLSVQAYENLTVYDMDGDRVLYGVKNEHLGLIASTTKVMTAVVALENSDLSNEFVVTKEDVDIYGSSIYLKVGDKITTKDLLYGLMLRSGNDAALTLANHIYGHDTFVDLMNQKSYYIGMKYTNFGNPHGLDDETENTSTTDDMAKLIAYAVKNNEFRKIASARKYIFNNETWYNKNELLGIYKYATSGKTGYTPHAGYTFVSTASKNGMNLAIATFRDKDRFFTHKKLYEEFFSKYKKYEILNKYSFFINDKNNKDTHLYIKNSYSMMLTEEEKENLKINVNIYERQVNNKAGFISVKLNDKEVHREYIYALKYQNNKKRILDILT